MKRFFILFALLVGVQTLAFAHQPVMDMAPRWKKGFGFQIRQENHSTDKTLKGDDEIDNPLGRKRRVHKTWLEGVYTFQREARVTFKIPWVDQSRISVVNGKSEKQEGSGPGDLILGAPLKYYMNWKGGTHNFGFTPSIRLPTGRTTGKYPAGDGSTDAAVSFSYSLETLKWYHLYDVFYWFNQDGKKGIHEGDELGIDANIGFHPYHNNDNNTGVFVMLDTRVRFKEHGHDLGGDTGGVRLSVGPVLVGYWENVMARVEYGFPVYENVNGSQVSHGNHLSIGIGITF